MFLQCAQPKTVTSAGQASACDEDEDQVGVEPTRLEPLGGTGNGQRRSDERPICIGRDHLYDSDLYARAAQRLSQAATLAKLMQTSRAVRVIYG